jgi:hypothetical protein
MNTIFHDWTANHHLTSHSTSRLGILNIKVFSEEDEMIMERQLRTLELVRGKLSLVLLKRVCWRT